MGNKFSVLKLWNKFITDFLLGNIKQEMPSECGDRDKYLRNFLINEKCGHSVDNLEITIFFF